MTAISIFKSLTCDGADDGGVTGLWEPPAAAAILSNWLGFAPGKYMKVYTLYIYIYIFIYIYIYRYNAVVGVHDFRPRCTRGALGVPISATRELLNNSDRCPLHQVHERCRSPVCLQHCPICQYAVYRTY